MNSLNFHTAYFTSPPAKEGQWEVVLNSPPAKEGLGEVVLNSPPGKVLSGEVKFLRSRNTIFLFPFFLFPFLSSAQTYEKPKFCPPKEKHRNMRDEYERKQGLWKTFSASYICIAENNYLNDKKHGLCKRYYPHSGTLMEECEYFDGRKHGYEKKYYYTGANKQEGEYDLGLKTGVWVWYYLNTGEIRSEGKYVKGKKEGEWKLYNSRGDLKTTFVYKDGILISQNGVPVEQLKDRQKQTITN